MAYNNVLGLEYPNEDDYYSIDVINKNISKVATEAVKINTVVVAAYDSLQEAAKNADFVCPENEAGTVLNKALLSVNRGGTLVLLAGTYDINENVVLDKPLKVVGEGQSTVLRQMDDFGETFNIFIVDSRDVIICNMTLKDNTESTSPKWLIHVKNDGVIVENITFHFDYSVENDVSMLHFSKDCYEGVVRFCRFVRSFDTTESEEDYADVSALSNGFCGTFVANKRFENESTPSEVRLSFANSKSYDYTAISGQKTKVYVLYKLSDTLDNK